MSMVFDEFGRPYIIVKDQEQKQRLKGIDAIKVNTHKMISCPSYQFFYIICSPIF